MWTSLVTLAGLASLDVVRAVSRPVRSSNADKEFVRWPTNKIPFAIDVTAYSDEQVEDIWDAIARVSSGLENCIQFDEVDISDPKYKILVTNKGQDGVKRQRCEAYPGIYEPYRTAGKTSQRLIITDGPTGCMGKDDHFIMKYFAIVLGKVNEHKRPDRDQYIQMNPANLLSDTEKVYQIHPTVKSQCPYDYCSITHDAPDAFAKPGTDAFTVKKAPFYIPHFDSLSECDCKDLSVLYGCDVKKCQPFNCADPDGYDSAEKEQN